MGADAVTVFEGKDPVMLAMAETVLHDKGIPCVIETSTVGSRIQVAPEYRAAALDALDDLPEGPEIDDEAADSAWNQ